MNTRIRFIVALCSLAFCYSTVVAQSKKPASYPKPKVITSGLGTKPTAGKPSEPVISDAQKVSNQVLNVTKFLYLLGGIAKGIEDIDKDARANRAAVDKNSANKKSVIQTIRNIRAGLATLEVQFRTKASLKKYLPKIEGIVFLSEQAEDLAVAGKFSDCGRPLVQVVEKLSDTLVAMP